MSPQDMAKGEKLRSFKGKGDCLTTAIGRTAIAAIVSIDLEPARVRIPVSIRNSAAVARTGTSGQSFDVQGLLEDVEVGGFQNNTLTYVQEGCRRCRHVVSGLVEPFFVWLHCITTQDKVRLVCLTLKGVVIKIDVLYYFKLWLAQFVQSHLGCQTLWTENRTIKNLWGHRRPPERFQLRGDVQTHRG